MNAVHWTLRALLSHWRRHPVQFFSLFTGLWLATALLTGVQAINSQARKSYALANELVGGTPHASLETADGRHLPQAAFVDLRRQGWPVSPVLEGAVRLADGQRRLQVMGIEPLSLPAGTRMAGEPTDPRGLIDFISPPGQAWVAAQTLRELGLAPGARPRLADGGRLPPLQVRGRMAPGVVLVDIGVAQALLQAPGAVSRLLLPAGFDRPLPEPWTTLRWNRGSDNELGRLTDSFHLNLTALGLLAFAVGLFIVHAAIGLALEQRRPLLRTLRASGVGVGELLLALVVELGVLALLGGAAGVASGYLLAGLLLPDVAASLRGLYGAEIGGQLTLSPAWWLTGLGLALVGALVAGAGSLWRAARLPLLALAGSEAWVQAHRAWLRRQGAAAAVAALVAALAWAFGDSLASGLVMLGGLLLAAALALPLLLSAGLRLLPTRGRSPLAGWFIADARQQLPALSLALMALLLALAANVGAGSMTEGFRHTFTGWLDQRLAAELYVRPLDDAQAGAVLDWLRRRPEVTATTAVVDVELRLDGGAVELAGIPPDDPLYRDHWPLLQAVDAPWRALSGGDTLMLSEQLARRLEVGVGDVVSLPSSTAAWKARVVATYADYGNPRGHVLVDIDAVRRHWPQAAVGRIAARVEPGGVDATAQALQRAFDLGEDRVIDQARLKAYAAQVFERTFAATAALNSLTLGVAGIALFIALLTQAQGRLGQLAPLWATGVGRARLMQLNAAQTWLLTGLTLLLALPLGIVLAWCLVAVINVQAFGWRLPLQVFPGQLLRLAGWALLATWLASAWPLWKLWRSRPVDLLRVFSDER